MNSTQPLDAQSRAPVDTHSGDQPDLKQNDIASDRTIDTNLAQTILDHASTANSEELVTTVEKNKQLKVKIRSLIDEGVAEIALEIEGETPQTLYLTIAADSEEMTSFLSDFKASVEKDAADLKTDDYSVTEEGIFSDPRVAELVHMIFKQTTVLGISGENIVWNAPQPKDGSDPLAALREIEKIEIGKGDPEKPIENFSFSGVHIDSLNIGLHVAKVSFTDSCSVSEHKTATGIENEITGLSNTAATPDTSIADPDGAPDPDSDPATGRHTSQTVLKNENIDVAGLTAAVGITNDSITQARTEADTDTGYTPRTVYSPDPDSLLPGVCKAALLSIKPEASGTIRLIFKGNNLPGSGPESDADSVLEFTFSTKGVDDTAALEDTIKNILESEHKTALTTGESIGDHAIVERLLHELSTTSAITHFSIENALLTSHEGNQDIFANATLGGTTGLEAALDRDILENRPAIRNSIVQGFELAGIAGTIENSILSKLDVRSGHIDIVTDEASRLDKLSAIGATICGTINCPISGDFRRAVLGTEKQLLDGAAFGVTEQTLKFKIPSLIRDFIVDTIDAADGTSALTINGNAVDLSEFKANNKFTKRSLDSLKSSANFYIPDADSILKADQFLERMPAYEFIDERNRVMSIAAGNYTVQCTYHEPDDAAVLSGSRLTVDLTIAPNSTDPSATIISMAGLEAERALYSLKQLDKLNSDFEAVKFHHKAAAARANQTGHIDLTAAAAAAGVANQPARPSVATDEVTVLGDTRESDKAATASS